jgi:hypothetical protein
LRSPITLEGEIMLFGNKKTFAIEFCLDSDYGGRSFWGTLCYWIDNNLIGNLPNISIGTALLDSAWIEKDNGHRYHKQLFQMETIQLEDLLHRGLFGLDEKDTIMQFAVKETWARFRIDEMAGAFDGYNIYLIDGLNYSRVIVKNRYSNVIDEYHILLGQFDNTLHEVRDKWCEMDKIESLMSGE